MIYVIYARHYDDALHPSVRLEALYRTRDPNKLKQRRQVYLRQWLASHCASPANGGIEVHVEWPRRRAP